MIQYVLTTCAYLPRLFVDMKKGEVKLGSRIDGQLSVAMIGLQHFRKRIRLAWCNPSGSGLCSSTVPLTPDSD
eukprot:390732-Prorocentrum_minimum.AAC.1